MNGTYAFSIPGGGFVSFYDLVEVLGIEANDTNTEKDEIQELVDGVENITFSNPDLVSVSKVEETTTVGAIKEHLGLVCDYSVELTKDEIAEINAQEVKAGDWALIALKPFSTSESLTVTMKNGDRWSVKVTDAQVTSYKTAHVYDYDNRIYEIDISASSIRYTVDKSITLEFLTDASRSMYFPAQITPVEDGNYGNNLANWLRYHGDESQVYYTVADVGATATMYAVYYQRYTADRGQWFAMDASYYYDGASGASAKSVLMVNSKSSNNYREDITNQIKSNNGNQTFTLSGVINTAPDKVEGQDWTRLDYLKAALTAATRALYKLDPSAQVGVLTFAGRVYESFRANVNNEPWMLNRIDNISLYGGTNQKVALDYYWDSTAAYNDLSIFTNSSTKKQVAILITDGAPNTTSVNWGPNSIGGSATKLKNRNVELYTLGLSLDDVGDVNKNGLNGIATNASYAYQAQEGEEFALQIESMLRQILDKAKLVGEVSDTIDAAFYPVDINGNPIASGTTVTQADGKIATYVENADGSWTVTYSNAEIGWPSVDANDNPILDTYGNIQDPGWETSIYIKAKEDFMGGNHINTNVGDNNQVKATGFKQNSATNGIRNFDEPFINPLGVPYVNVDELKMDQNSTEWRVYLGTDVNPRDELLKLWNSIRVNLVVKDNGDDEDTVITISNGNQMYYSDARDNDAAAPDGTSNETLPLSNFVNNELIAGLISNLENGQKTATASLAPAGYIICESPMTIRLTLKDEYRDYKDPNPIITDISNTPYNWTQTVQKLAYANSKDGTGDSK